jgi:ribosomal-protein-alanine N-acetyltransferase
MSAAVQVRRALSSEASALSELHRECFDDAWGERSFRALLDDEQVFALIAAGAEALLEALILVREAAGEAEILTLGTRPALRRTGLARALVLAGASEALARGAGEIFLEVSEVNRAARSLYSGLGFSAVGRRRGYYRSNDGAEDALVLRAKLPLCE